MVERHSMPSTQHAWSEILGGALPKFEATLQNQVALLHKSSGALSEVGI